MNNERSTLLELPVVADKDILRHMILSAIQFVTTCSEQHECWTTEEVYLANRLLRASGRPSESDAKLDEFFRYVDRKSAEDPIIIAPVR